MLQLLVQVYDSSNPSQRAATTVTITVQRNVNAPQFSRSEYTARIVESYPIGSSVLGVRATDRDGDEVRYRVLSGQAGASYFFLNPLSGDLSLAKPLSDSTEKAFTVGSHAMIYEQIHFLLFKYLTCFADLQNGCEYMPKVYNVHCMYKLIRTIFLLTNGCFSDVSTFPVPLDTCPSLP